MRPLIILTLLALTACTTPGPAPTPPPPPTTTTSTAPRPALVITPGDVEAASGLRAMTLTITNQDTTPHSLTGYPALRVLGKDHQPMQVDIVPGAAGITSGFDTPPHTVTLEPGKKATASVLWRNTVTDATVKATTGTYLDTAPTAGSRGKPSNPGEASTSATPANSASARGPCALRPERNRPQPKPAPATRRTGTLST